MTVSVLVGRPSGRWSYHRTTLSPARAEAFYRELVASGRCTRVVVHVDGAVWATIERVAPPTAPEAVS